MTCWTVPVSTKVGFAESQSVDDTVPCFCVFVRLPGRLLDCSHVFSFFFFFCALLVRTLLDRVIYSYLCGAVLFVPFVRLAHFMFVHDQVSCHHRSSHFVFCSYTDWQPLVAV